MPDYEIHPDELAELKAEIELLRAALKPLAEKADQRDGIPDGWMISVPLGELRVAARALEQEEDSK